MTTITIRDVPEEARAELAARAARGGRSLQEYLRAELIELARKPDAQALVARIRERKREHPVDIASDEIVDLADADRR